MWQKNEFDNLVVKMWAGKVGKLQLLYVPVGMLTCETCTTGPLCFGIRKSCFARTKQAKRSYGAMVDLMAADGRDMTKMKKVLEKLDAA